MQATTNNADAWEDKRCFACGRVITAEPPPMADTRDGQLVYVGPECMRRIVTAGDEGYQPPKGGPRLWTLATPPHQGA